MIGRVAMRIILLLAAAGMVIAVVYLPVRLVLRPQRSAEFNQVKARVIQGVSTERAMRERRLPPFFGVRVLVNNLVAVGIVAFVGRRVLRLSLKR